MTNDSSSKFNNAHISQLREQIVGTVFQPGDEGYDTARMPWNISFAAQHPALVVMANSAADISTALNFANEHDLGVALQATGHGVIRRANEALLINTANMTGVTIDPAKRTAYVEAGAVWGDVLGPAQKVGLAPLLGSSPGVGAVGYTLGGGMGWLVRKYGIAADNVRYFDVVTASGEQKRVSAAENSDLFWGLCGGRSTFAVICGMEIDLFPISMVYGGSIIYPAALARDILVRYRDWITTTPEELTTSVILMNMPPLPFIPELLRGKSVIMVRACYCGPLEEAEAHFQTWQKAPEPMANFLGPMPFSQVAMISQDPEEPLPGFVTGAWIDALDDDVVDALIQYLYVTEGPPPLVFTEIRHVGGAKGRVDPARNAVSHRQESLVLQILGLTPSPDIYEQVVGYSDNLIQAIETHVRGVYPNFIEGLEAQKVISKAFAPETHGRLKALKAQVDPQNRFRYGLEF